MFPVHFWLAVVCAPLGLALLAVGGVLRLTEWGWKAPTGANGSRGLLVVGAVLCLPAAVLFAPAVLAWLTGSP